jgi:parallel beta-helix repeat protein
MTFLGKTSTILGTANLLFLLIGIIPYLQQQQQPHYFNTAEAGEEGQCIDYDQTENTIAIDCNASFLDVVQTVNDPNILENLGAGQYLLNANLEVDDGATFEITSSSNEDDNLQYLKITGVNGIIVHGRIEISNVKITSWSIESNSPVFQTITGSVPRAFINLRESEGGFVHDSEIAYLGYQEFGRRGFDLFGGGGPSHDLEIRGSKFHDMWFAFYSRGAYNIKVDGNEYYNNIKYALDPHSGTHDMSITNNWLHHNPIGAICSDRCFNILIEGNLVEDNRDYGIFFSRNMYDSIARNNHIFNTTSGITVSESPNNQIYNNTIEGATSQGIRLFNPILPDDGFTENNLVYDNVISNSDDGISAARSHGNILENNRFSNIQSSEYRLSGDSTITIRGQQFDNALISAEGSAINNFVEIVDSGIIEVNDRDADDEDEEEVQFNTDETPFSRRLGDGDSILINS